MLRFLSAFSVYEAVLVSTGHNVTLVGWFVKVEALKESFRDSAI